MRWAPSTGWAVSGKLDPLAEALLGHQPLPQVQAAFVQDSPVPAALLFDAAAYPDALKLLLGEHPDITVVTPIGNTVLMQAAKYNNLESVKLLLAAGANVNASSLAPADIEGNAEGELCTDGGYIITHGQRTGLMHATANAGLPVIKVLLAAGADKHAKDSTGATALVFPTPLKISYVGKMGVPLLRAFSYGFRPKRGQHDAPDALAVGIDSRKVGYILDADIRSFFDEVSQK